MRLKFAATLMVSLWVGGFLSAENKLFINNQTVQAGAAGVSIPILLNSDQTLYGFSLSLKCDVTKLKIVDPGIDLVGAVVPDAGWSFGQWETDGSHVTWGVVLDVTEPFDVSKVIPEGQGLHLANLRVDVTATAAGSAVVTFENVPANPTANPPEPGAKNLLVGDQGETVAMATPANGTITITADVQPTFIRGDANASGAVDISDAVYALNFLFIGGPEPPCKDAADSDDSGVVNITDPIYALAFLFQGGPSIKLPYPAAGVDPTDEVPPLGCGQ
jgi:hypothetical protein